MPTTNLSIGSEPVVDFACSGWPLERRNELFRATTKIGGVTDVTGAGVSTMRVRYDPAIVTYSDLLVAVDRIADDLLPGHRFSL